jgi:flagellar motor switch protein FliG
MESRMAAKAKRTPMEKVAILLQVMGEDVAAKIVQSLPLSEVQRMTQTLIKMEPPDSDEARTIATEFMAMVSQRGGLLMAGEDFAKAVINKAFDKVSASRLLDNVTSPVDHDTFEALNRMDPRVISEFTKAEHPQTTALILAHLQPAMAGKVLSQLPEVVRTEVTLRLARLKEVSPTILEEITAALQTDLLNLSAGGQDMGGLKKVAEILNHADKSVEADILKRIREEDAPLADGIQQLMFTFDDVAQMDDRAVQEILREVDIKLLAKALRGSNEDVQQKVFGNMSQRAAEVLREDMDALGPTRLSEVEEAQIEIIKVILRLRDESRIVIGSSGEKDVFV